MSKVSCHICGDQIETKSDLYIGKSQLSRKSAPFHADCWTNQDPSHHKQYRFWKAPYNGEQGKITHKDDLKLAAIIMAVSPLVIFLISLIFSGSIDEALYELLLYSIAFFIVYWIIVFLGNLQLSMLRRQWHDLYEKHLPD